MTGMCTAMRRGDCCKLVRDSVDLESDFITVKTSKTGETVQIPIFPLLRRVLVKAMTQPEGPAPHYVFPELTGHYRTNPNHLTDRVRRVLKAAGFFNAKNEEEKSRMRGEAQRMREDGLRRASVRLPCVVGHGRPDSRCTLGDSCSESPGIAPRTLC